jgi:hypothetical protein
MKDIVCIWRCHKLAGGFAECPKSEECALTMIREQQQTYGAALQGAGRLNRDECRAEQAKNIIAREQMEGLRSPFRGSIGQQEPRRFKTVDARACDELVDAAKDLLDAVTDVDGASYLRVQRALKAFKP